MVGYKEKRWVIKYDLTTYFADLFVAQLISALAIITPMPDQIPVLPFTIPLILALLKNFESDKVVDRLLDMLVGILGEELREKLKNISKKNSLAKQILDAERLAQICIEERVKDDSDLYGAITNLPLVDLPSLNETIQGLTTDLSENKLVSTLERLFTSDFPQLSKTQHRRLVNIYWDCLRRALLNIPEYGQRIVDLTIYRIDKVTQRTEGKIDAQTELLRGLVSLPTDYSTRIENFFIEYLGTPHHPTPFGGRQNELKALDDWLMNPEASPYTLIAAEAGTGKSTLLIRWAQSLQERGIASVAFIPISITFNISLESIVFSALSSRLSQIYKEPITYFNLSPEQWRGICQDFLRKSPPSDKPIVVIIDGIDEAVGWYPGPDLFPFSPPPGVRAVVSARIKVGDRGSSEWLQRLGWDIPGRATSMSLPALTREGVIEILSSMRDQLGSLTNRTDMVNDLYNLSQGDPLIVRLYIDALLPHGREFPTLKPEELPSIDQGLSGYFNRWWEDQRRQWGNDYFEREQVTHALIATLATAVGPLLSTDLLEIIPSNIGLTAYMLEENLRSLSRLVIGDGLDAGFSFSHPRLRNYFYDKLSIKEKNTWESYFLSYCYQTLENIRSENINSEQISTYCVQFYGSHLDRSQADLDDYFPLVSDEWISAWFGIEGGFNGLLGDIDRVLRKVESYILNRDTFNGLIKSDSLVLHVKSALCIASINSLSSSISPSLLATLLNYKILTPPQVLGFVRQISDEYQRSETLSIIMPYVSDDWFDEIYTIIRSISNDHALSELIDRIAVYIPSIYLNDVISFLSNRNNNYLFGSINSILTQRKFDIDHQIFTEILTNVRNIDDSYLRCHSLLCLLPHSSNKEHERIIKDAIDAAYATQDPIGRSIGLFSVSRYISPTEQKEVLRDAYLNLRQVYDEHSLAWHMRMFASEIPEDQTNDILGILRSMRSETERALAIKNLAPHLSSNKIVEVLDITREMSSEYARASAFMGLVPYLPDELLSEVLNVVRGINDDVMRAGLLSILISRLPHDIQKIVAEEALDAWENMGGKILYSFQNPFTKLVPFLAPYQFSRAFGIVLKIFDDSPASEAMIYLIKNMPSELIHEAFDCVQKIEEDEPRSRALIAISPFLQGKLIERAIDEARKFQNNNLIALTLFHIALQLTGEKQWNIVNESYATAFFIQHETDICHSIVSIIPYLSTQHQGEAVSIVWEKIDRLMEGISDRSEEEQKEILEILKKLTPYLSGNHQIKIWNLILEINKKSGFYFYDLIEAIAPYIPSNLILDALEIINTLEDKGMYELALSSIIHYLPSELKAKYTQIIEKIRAEYNDPLPPFVSEHAIKNLDELIMRLDEYQQDESERARFLIRSASSISDWSVSGNFDLPRIWVSMIRIFSRQPRDIFLEGLRLYLPLAFSLIPESDVPQAAYGFLNAIIELASFFSST